LLLVDGRADVHRLNAVLIGHSANEKGRRMAGGPGWKPLLN
jgi:hypothetical protein